MPPGTSLLLIVHIYIYFPVEVYGTVTFVKQQYTPKLNDSGSQEYQAMSDMVCDGVCEL